MKNVCSRHCCIMTLNLNLVVVLWVQNKKGNTINPDLVKLKEQGSGE